MGSLSKTWRMIRGTFIPKPGKIGQDPTRALRSIITMKFILKPLEKLFDRRIRGIALVKRALVALRTISV